MLKRSSLKPQQFSRTLNVQFKHTRTAGLLLAQPLPPLIVHDSMSNVMSHAMQAADKWPNIRQLKINKQRGKSTQTLYLGRPYWNLMIESNCQGKKNNFTKPLKRGLFLIFVQHQGKQFLTAELEYSYIWNAEVADKPDICAPVMHKGILTD